MIGVLLYLAVAAGCAPALTRHRYDRLRASHPHTHPIDVRHDLTRAVVQGVGAAMLWLPLGCLRAGRYTVLHFGVRAVGRRTVAGHLREARTEQWEAELATTAPPDDLDGLIRDAAELRAALDEYAARNGDSARLEDARRRVEARSARLTRMIAS